MTSRFFATGGSDNESDDSGSDASGMGGQMQNRDQTQTAMLMYDSSSSEEEKRVIRSGRDKRYEAMTATLRVLRNSMKINDWVAVVKGFDTLNKLVDKAKAIIQREGIPRPYIKMLCSLDSKIEEVGKDAKKKMSTANNKALNTMRQKLRKTNRQYEKFIAEYRASPDHGGAVSEEDNEEKPQRDSDDDSDEEEEADEVEEDSEESEEDDDQDGDDEPLDDEFDFESDVDSDAASSESSDSDIDLSMPAMSRAFWVKKSKGDDEEISKAERRRLRQAPKAGVPTASTKKSAAAKLKSDAATAADLQEIEFTPELIYQKLMAIQSVRGKRGSDRYGAVRELKLLASKANSVPAIIKIKIVYLSAMFDVNFNSGSHMQLPLWKAACDALSSILSLLEQSTNVFLIEDNEDIEETVFAEEAAAENARQAALEGSSSMIEGGDLRSFIPQARSKREDNKEFIAGLVYSFAARLSEEFVSSLQNIDPHTQDYLDRLQDEPTLMRLLFAAQKYYTRLDKIKFVSLLALLRVEFLSVKYDPLYDVQSENHVVKTITESGDPLVVLKGEPDLVLHRLCAILYEHGDDRSKARAVICTAHHYAMHGNFHKARDLFLMSHVQDSIAQADISTQILYNRAVAMMSVCAFRHGLMHEALNIVADLYGTGKIKELLAQGVASIRWQQKRDTEQENLERRRQMPYHVHISLDLLESVHLISAMLLEVPNLALHAHDDKRHVISRNFRRLWDGFHKNAFNGPPENTRDYVIAAAISIGSGQWDEAYQHLMQLKMWSLLPHADKCQAILLQKVKEVGLRVYLLSHGSSFSNLCSDRLAEQFDLSPQVVHALSSKLMSSEKLAGAWDEPTNAINMRISAPNEMQSAALRFADIIGIFVEQNERSMEHRHVHAKGSGGGPGGKPDWQQQQQAGGRGGDRRAPKPSGGGQGRW